jgi:anaerobic dimethyl sulfoxide reductase subunit A
MGGNVASLLTYGTLHASNNRDDLLNSKLIIMWGWDPATTVTGTNTICYLFQAKERGATFISVDPRYTDSAAILAPQWIPIRPSTDAAMAIALAYVMISEKIYDRKFIDTYTIGFDKFKDYVLGVEDGIAKSPDWAMKITGVPAATIERLARQYATTKPAALMPSGAPGRTAYGEQFHRATATLAAMTGNIGIHGGYPAARAWESIYGGYPYNVKFFKDRVDQYAVRQAPPGKEVAERRKTQIHRLELPDMILKGKAGGYPADCKLVFLASSNYLNQAANVNKTARAFQVVEFIVLVEQFMTPTAKFADILLPANSFMERNDITLGWHSSYIASMPKIIDSIGESKSILQIAVELAKHMGVTDFLDKDEEEMLREMVAECGITDFDQFRERGYHKIKLAEPYVAFKEQIEDPKNHPFPTPSGKIEIYSQRWAELNNPELPPVPKYIEAKEIWRSPLAKKYPLQFISTHFRKRALSQFDNVPWMRELGGQELQINRVDALARGISDGERVRVFNDRGELLIRAKVTDRIMPGVVHLPQGAWYNPDARGLDRGASANVLTHGEYSPAGAWPLNTNLVEVERYGDI